MLQTILGFTVLIVGLAGVLFNERLAKSHIAFNRWALGLEPFAPNLRRGQVILVGISFFIFGLLMALHVIPVD